MQTVPNPAVLTQGCSHESGRGGGGGFWYQGCIPYDSYDVMNKWPPTDGWGLVHNHLPLNETLSAS